MTTAKVFWSGNSQAIRLPREMRFAENVGEVELIQEGDRLILSPIRNREFGEDFFAVLGSMPDFKRPPSKRTKRRPIFP